MLDAGWLGAPRKCNGFGVIVAVVVAVVVVVVLLLLFAVDRS